MSITKVALSLLMLAILASPMHARARGNAYLFVLPRIYKINPVDGQLERVANGPSLESYTVNPTQTIVYSLSHQELSAFHIDSASGTLTPLPGSPYKLHCPAGCSSPLALNPAGTILYMGTDSSQAGLYFIHIDRKTRAPFGALSAWQAKGGYNSGIQQIAFNRTGSTMYLVQRSIYVYHVNRVNGTLSRLQKLTWIFGEYHVVPLQITLNAAGNIAYLLSAEQIASFSIDPSTGRLRQPATSWAYTGNDAIRSSSDDDSTVEESTAFVITRNGRFIYVSDSGASYVSGFRINRLTGKIYQSIEKKDPSGMASEFYLPGHTCNLEECGDEYSGPYDILLSPNGRFAYVIVGDAFPGQKSILEYHVDDRSGKIAPLPQVTVLPDTMTHFTPMIVQTP